MKELSELLKSERLKQGLTLQAVSERAHVSVNMLQSLEEEQYDRIGTPLLIRSFIKAYCDALGIDHVPLLESREVEILSYDRQDEGIRRYGVCVKALHQRGRKGILLFSILALAVVAALYGGAWLSKSKGRLSGIRGATGGIYSQQELPTDLQEGAAGPSGDETMKEASTNIDQSAKLPAEVSDDKTEKADAPAVVGKATDQQAAKLGTEGANPAEVLVEDKPKPASQELHKHHLEVEAAQKTWIQVKIDGKKVQNAMLRAGDKREWEAENNMQIVVGNGGGVSFKWDGQPLGAMGKPGRILRLRLPNSEPARKPANP